jgi:hypothetical protein
MLALAHDVILGFVVYSEKRLFPLKFMTRLAFVIASNHGLGDIETQFSNIVYINIAIQMPKNTHLNSWE